jgi:hypothetical protein
VLGRSADEKKQIVQLLRDGLVARRRRAIFQAQQVMEPSLWILQNLIRFIELGEIARLLWRRGIGMAFQRFPVVDVLDR